MFGKHPAGNVMLSFGILTSGAKISQALLMFKNMGLSADILLPLKEVPLPLSVKLLENATVNTSCKEIEEPQWSGDGRFDSMGHGAKYGVYTMYSNSTSKLAHFETTSGIAYLI